MKRVWLLLLMFGLAWSESALAQRSPVYYGRWYCADCSISPSDPAGSLPDLYIFLRSTQITDQWVPGDTITICDDTYCMDVSWRGSTWLPTAPVYPNPNSSGGYKNTPRAYNQGCVKPCGGPNGDGIDWYLWYIISTWRSPLKGTVEIRQVPIVLPDGDPPAGPGSGDSTSDSLYPSYWGWGSIPTFGGNTDPSGYGGGEPSFNWPVGWATGSGFVDYGSGYYEWYTP